MNERVADLKRREVAGEYLSVIRMAQALLASPEHLTDEEGVEVARAGMMAAMALERYHQACQFAEAERHWAEGIGTPEYLGAAAYHHGTVLMHLGDNQLCLEKFREFFALDTPPRPELDRYRGAAHFNRGVALMQRREFREAVGAFLCARDAFHQTGDIANQIRCYLEAAWAELMAHRAEPAGYYLNQAGELLACSPSPDLQVVALCHRALYHFQVGEIAEAVALCEEVLTPGRPGVTAHHLSEAAWICGECVLAMGRPREAMACAMLALDEATKAKWPALMNQALDLRRRIHDAESRPA